MNLHTIDVTIIVIYLVLCLVIGLKNYGKIQSIRDYTLGTQRFSTAVLVATTFATVIGAGHIIGNLSKIYQMGLVFIVPLFCIPIRWTILAKIFANNIHRFQKFNFISLSEIMYHYYGQTGRWVTNILSLIVAISITAASAIAIGYLLNYFMQIPENIGIIIGITIVTMYSTLGGIASVAFTDVFQFLIFFIAFPVACIVGYQATGGIENIIIDLPPSYLSIDKSNMTFFLSLAFASLLPTTEIPYIQRALMAKDKKQFTHTFIAVGLLFIPFLAIISLIGLMVYKFDPNLNANIVLYYFVDHYLAPGLKGLMISGVLAIIMSTQDSFLNTTSSLISHDICKKLWPSLEKKHELLIARVSCVVISFASISIVFFKSNIIDIVWLTNNFWDPLITFPLLAGLLGARISNMSFNVLVILSIFATLIARYFTGAFDTRSLVAGVLTSVMVLYVGNKRYKKKHPELVQKKTSRESLIIRLKNSVFSKSFDTQSLYVVTIILCAGFIIGTAFLGFHHFNVLNVSFLFLSTAFLLLLLSDIWGDSTHRITLFVWQILFVCSLVLLPSYTMVVSDFNIFWIINFVISIALFSTFTNKTKAIIFTVFGVICIYIISKFFPYTFRAKVSQSLALIYIGFVVISLALAFYQTRYVGKEVIRQLETKVEERTSALKKALYAKQEFLNKLGHEVRTPIHHIIGIARGLSDGWSSCPEEDRKKYIDMISDNADRLMSYTSNILDLASIKQNKFVLKVDHNVDLVKIAKEIIKDSELLISAKNKNLRIKLNVEEALPLINGDSIKIGQIFRNLLHNSIKYSVKGDIVFSIKNSAGSVIIAIADSGVGIPAAEKDKIFESFYESSRTRNNAEGKGLGLAIVKEFVSLHNGIVKVEDNRPAGSVFIVELPLK